MIVDPTRLLGVVLDALAIQDDHVQADLIPHIRAGETVVFRDAEPGWVRIMVADAMLARVHESRLLGAGRTPEMN